MTYTEQQIQEAIAFFGADNKDFFDLIESEDDIYSERVIELMDWILEKVGSPEVYNSITGEDLKKFMLEYYYNVIKKQ